LVGENRFRGHSCKLALTVRLMKRAAANAEARKPIETTAQPMLVADATDNDVGMFVERKNLGGFKRGVTGLHHLVRMGQIPTDENIQIRFLRINLRELHDESPLRTRERKRHIASGGI
jgi:hypothetical protein